MLKSGSEDDCRSDEGVVKEQMPDGGVEGNVDTAMKEQKLVCDDVIAEVTYSGMTDESDLKGKREGYVIDSYDKNDRIQSMVEDEIESQEKVDREQVGSPYMVIQAPSIEEQVIRKDDLAADEKEIYYDNQLNENQICENGDSNYAKVILSIC